MHPLSALALITALSTSAGCLAPSRGDAGNGDIDSHGEDTIANDTTAIDTTAIDIQDDTIAGCSDALCDDSDPCTRDYCDAQQECQHAALSGPEVIAQLQQCTGDIDCQASNPCGRCSPLAQCGQTVGICEAISGCDFACGSDQALTASALANLPAPPAYAKVAGRIMPSLRQQSCDDGPQCACTDSPAITDDNVNLLLSGAVGGQEFNCDSSYCDIFPTRCGPAQAEGYYWVWGATVGGGTSHSDSDGQPHIPPRPTNTTGLNVVDYCLQTTPEGLPGVYTGTMVWTHGWDTTEFIAHIAADSSNILWLTIDEITQGGATPSSIPPMRMSPGDGYVGVAVSDVGVPAPLYSHRNTLSGTLETYALYLTAKSSPYKVPAQPPATGIFTLTRTGALP